MATKTEKLFDAVKGCQWEYANSRYIDEKEFTVKDNMDEKLENEFVGYVTNKDSRDGFSLRYTCPIIKTETESGRIKRIELIYEKQKWEVIPRINMKGVK